MAPPPGDPPHRYQFTVYALDVPALDSGPNTTYAKFRFLIRGHVLAQGTLTGTYAVKGWCDLPSAATSGHPPR